jgi:hypothetical protein
MRNGINSGPHSQWGHGQCGRRKLGTHTRYEPSGPNCFVAGRYICAPALSSALLSRTSAITPITSDPCPPAMAWRPMGFCPGHSFRATVSLMPTTLRLFTRSSQVMSARPSRPNVPCKRSSLDSPTCLSCGNATSISHFFCGSTTEKCDFYFRRIRASPISSKRVANRRPQLRIRAIGRLSSPMRPLSREAKSFSEFRSDGRGSRQNPNL